MIMTHTCPDKQPLFEFTLKYVLIGDPKYAKLWLHLTYKMFKFFSDSIQSVA